VSWELGGRLVGGIIADRIAKGRSEQERIAARPPRTLFRPVSAPLPVEAWYEAPELYVGYPWGWMPADLSAEPDTDEAWIGVFHAERHDDVAATIGLQRGDAMTVDEFLDGAGTLLEDRAKALGLEPHSPISYVLVDKELALVVQTRGRPRYEASATGTSVVVDAFTVHRGRLFLAQLTAPEKDHLAYLQVFWTVLGTWTWHQ
jgi:hypothetical protein